MKSRNLILALIVTNIWGCAFTTESVDIKYDPQQNVKSIPSAKQVTIDVRVRDSRIDKSKVSSKKNGYGIETAPILANQKPEITVSHAIEQELTLRGFRISQDAQIDINAEISQFYNEHKLGFLSGDAIADFDMIVKVNSRTGQELYFKRIKTQGIEADTQLMSAENAALALNLALKNGIKMLFDDSAFISSLLTTVAQ